MQTQELIKQRKICQLLLDMIDDYSELCEFACLFDEHVEGGMPEGKKFYKAFRELQTLLNVDVYSFQRQKHTPE